MKWPMYSMLIAQDVPEPGTGELDYVKVTKWFREKGYTGITGMEDGLKTKGQEDIDAYRKIDAL